MNINQINNKLKSFEFNRIHSLLLHRRQINYYNSMGNHIQSSKLIKYVFSFV